VRLLASVPDYFELLLERAQPGHDLWTVPDDGARLDIAAELMRRLWRPVTAETVRSVGSTARAWADTTERRLVTSEVPWVTGPIERGIDLLRSLPRDASERTLVHGDFHPGNILAAEREPWLAIDPKPLVGDPAFEPIQLLTQRAGRLTEPTSPDEAARRITAIAERSGLDADRIAQWGIARCAEWSMWSWEHGHTIDAAIAYTWARMMDQLG
jgi:streptomycin 6-kinase